MTPPKAQSPDRFDAKAEKIVDFEIEWIELCGFHVQRHSAQAMVQRYAAALRDVAREERERCVKALDEKGWEWNHAGVIAKASNVIRALESERDDG